MILSDFFLALRWWGILFAIGVGFFPLTCLLFDSFFDKGYVFGKLLGLMIITYAVFLFGTLHLFPFTQLTILNVSIYCIVMEWIFVFFFGKAHWKKILHALKTHWHRLVLEELLFFSLFLLWTYIRGFAPDARGVEKFMDFGFLNAILRTGFFPTKDMWLTPYSINYYYFGHITTAVLTKLSGLPSPISFNLMFATLFAATGTGVFSLSANLLKGTRKRKKPFIVAAAFLTAFLTTTSGNLHTVYAFFAPYANETPVPFWHLVFKPASFPNSYWYPNASRFIYHTIHEFPSYAFIVSDLHGHLLDTPFVILTIAVLYSLIFNSKFKIFNQKEMIKNSMKIDPFGKLRINAEQGRSIENSKLKIIFLGFLLAVLYMTNAWDGIIYFLLTSVIVFLLANRYLRHPTDTKPSFFKRLFRLSIIDPASTLLLLFFSLICFTLPFSIFFKPFASQIGVLCSPKALTNIGHLGPFLFEPDHCQHSPWWQLMLLYGFFAFWLVPFGFFFWKKKEKTRADIFIVIISLLSFFLILIPEFVYLKDIYPAHYRANTMFKLVYEAFIMLSIATGYAMTQLISNIKCQISNFKLLEIGNYWKLVVFVLFFCVGSILMMLVATYPVLGINSYYNSLKTYQGLNGWKYLQTSYPNDLKAFEWLTSHPDHPVVLEGFGDSYTDYGRVSSNTGLPTLLGWLDHEWLWHDSYDFVAPRITDIKTIYETPDVNIAKKLLTKYNVIFIYLSDLERQKYPGLNEQKLSQIARVVFQSGTTKIYEVSR